MAKGGKIRRFAFFSDHMRLFAGCVLFAALATFLGWLWWGDGSSWPEALDNALCVAIVACPGLLAWSIPLARRAALGRLVAGGIIPKSTMALDRLAEVDTVVFDKTGALALGCPELRNRDALRDEDLRLAASIAAASEHPVARALARAVDGTVPAEGVREYPGCGLEWRDYRLGNRRWLDIPDEPGQAEGPELFLLRRGDRPVRFAFSDALRPDAAESVAALAKYGYDMALLSCDRAPTVSRAARTSGIKRWLADLAPGEKRARLAELQSLGRRVLMVGDGLGGDASLAAAHVSMSPACCADFARTGADVAFQGEFLSAVAEALGVARRAEDLGRQSLVLALSFYTFAIPFAVLGRLTPLGATIALSIVALCVMANALRLAREAS